MSTSDTPDKENKKEELVESGIQQMVEAKKQVLASQAVIENAIRSVGFARVFALLQQRMPTLKNLTLELLEERIKQAFSILVRGLSGFIALLVIVGSIRGIFSENYIFQDFTVPESYEKIGISGEVLKNKIIYQANTLVDKKDFPFSAKHSSIPDEDIEIMGVSVNAIFGMIRAALNRKPTFIKGSLINHKTELTLELNIDQKNSKIGRETEIIKVQNCSDNTKQCIDKIIRSAAYWLLSFEEPFPSAHYYYRQDSFEKARNIVRNAIAKIDTTDDARKFASSKMHNLWGEILREPKNDMTKDNKTNSNQHKRRFRHNNNHAKDKFEKASIKASNSIPQAWANLADISFEINRPIYEHWFNNKDTATLEKKYELMLGTIMDYYDTGDSLKNIFKNEQDTTLHHFEPMYRVDVELYVKASKQDTLLQFTLDSTEEQSLVVNRYEDFLSLAQKFKETKKYDLATDVYIQYLDHIKQNEESDEFESLLFDMVGKNHPFLEILKMAPVLEQLIVEKKDTLKYKYYQLIERMVYFDWEYDLFAFDYTEEEVIAEETTILNIGKDRDTLLWSELSILPDPQLTNGILGSFTEKLWYYLSKQYDEDRYLSDDEFFVSDSLDHQIKEVKQFFSLKGEGDTWYQSLHNDRTYKDWDDYREGATFSVDRVTK